ncbi:hypothetical protein Poli38472_004059 [Pythium oligandrum]|uniref:Transcription factor CBF/NF-Y/archaeal histone domain-containing protein n=1 Tax=Pythium oligandrum TaxID=41045 RepID=A0A8K1CMM6_PYTOL|nr:hypothetical protein Poli38472_004059 [Pythium oligandrum]|eukprot:TMW66294.1 hypothetical protein Poli38472_004059 [Pythium oligandrum]
MTARAVKQTLPERTIVSKDAKAMMNTAASMFTLYLTTIAHDVSSKNKRSTITLKDVLSALREADLEHFIEPVEQCLQDTKAMEMRKRAKKEAGKAAPTDGNAASVEATAHDAVADEQDEVPMETDADLPEATGDESVEEEEEEEEEEVNDDEAAVRGQSTASSPPDDADMLEAS